MASLFFKLEKDITTSQALNNSGWMATASQEVNSQTTIAEFQGLLKLIQIYGPENTPSADVESIGKEILLPEENESDATENDLSTNSDVKKEEIDFETKFFKSCKSATMDAIIKQNAFPVGSNYYYAILVSQGTQKCTTATKIANLKKIKKVLLLEQVIPTEKWNKHAVDNPYEENQQQVPAQQKKQEGSWAAQWVATAFPALDLPELTEVVSKNCSNTASGDLNNLLAKLTSYTGLNLASPNNLTDLIRRHIITADQFGSLFDALNDKKDPAPEKSLKLANMGNFLSLIDHNVKSAEEFTPLFDILNDKKDPTTGKSLKLANMGNFLTLIDHNISNAEEFNSLFDALNDKKDAATGKSLNLANMGNFLSLVDHNIHAEEFTPLFDALNERNLGTMEIFIFLHENRVKDAEDFFIVTKSKEFVEELKSREHIPIKLKFYLQNITFDKLPNS